MFQLSSASDHPFYDQYNGLLELITTHCVKNKYRSTSHLVYNILCIPFRRPTKSLFPQMNFPRLTEYYIINNFFLYTKGMVVTGVTKCYEIINPYLVIFVAWHR